MLDWFLETKLGRGILALSAFAVALVGAFFAGKREQNKEQQVEDLQEKVETQRRMSDADVSRGDGDADLDWLRKRSKR